MEIRNFKIGGHFISADFVGGGDELIFCLHGLGCSRRTYRRIEEELGSDRYSIICPDLLGFGQSAKPDDFSYSLEDQAEICALLLKQLGYVRLHIIAHSMGGAIGVLLPPEILNRVESFVNIEGNLIAADCTVTRRAIAAGFEKFKEELLPEYKAELKDYADLDNTAPLAYYRASESMVPWTDSGQLLSRFLALKCRKIYVFGDRNREHPAVAATKSVPQVQISGSGHFPMEDNPKEFYSALRRFLI